MCESLFMHLRQRVLHVCLIRCVCVCVFAPLLACLDPVQGKKECIRDTLVSLATVNRMLCHKAAADMVKKKKVLHQQ